MPRRRRLAAERPDYELMFLNVAHPNETKGRANKRLIRSHTTAWQHQKKRAADALSAPGLAPSTNAEDPREDPATTAVKPNYRRSNSAPSAGMSGVLAPLEFVNTIHPAEGRSVDARKQIRGYLAREQHRKRKLAEAAELPTSTGPSKSSSVPSSPSDETQWASLIHVVTDNDFIEQATTWIRHLALQDDTGQLNEAVILMGCTVEHAMYLYTALLDSQLPVMRPSGPEERGGLDMKQQVLAFMLTDPMLLLVALLLSISRSLGKDADDTPMLLLHGYVVSALNEALRDSIRAFSNQIILSVSLLAIYEANYGKAEVYHLHMSAGLLKMIEARGGVESLGGGEFLQRMILWNDASCASVVGCQPYLQIPE